MPPPGKTELVSDRDGERLDQFIARSIPDLSRARVQRLIDAGDVRIDGGGPAKASLRLTRGQRVAIEVPAPVATAAAPEDIALDILYEDRDLIVVNKAPGMAVHPAPGHARSTLVNAILSHAKDLSGVGGVLRPGIVHRLDRDTSGVILVAKNDAAHHDLARQLKERSVEKTYIALVEGTPSPPEGLIDAPIARDPRGRKRMAIIAGGREAMTAYRLIESFASTSLVEARPKTGRTHQIRVHLAAIAHPIVGDAIYGKRSDVIGRQFLHAARIAFAHPRTASPIVVEAPLAPDLEAALATLRAAGG